MYVRLRRRPVFRFKWKWDEGEGGKICIDLFCFEFLWVGKIPHLDENYFYHFAITVKACERTATKKLLKMMGVLCLLFHLEGIWRCLLETCMVDGCIGEESHSVFNFDFPNFTFLRTIITFYELFVLRANWNSLIPPTSTASSFFTLPWFFFVPFSFVRVSRLSRRNQLQQLVPKTISFGIFITL